MPTFDIYVKKTGTERHTVNAPDFIEAKRLFEEGVATLKDDETTEVHGIVFDNMETGERCNEEDIGDEDVSEERSFAVTIGADLRGYAIVDGIMARNAEEARAGALARLNQDAHWAAGGWTWRLEEIKGDISLAAEDEDSDGNDVEREFVSVPNWSGADYTALEAFVRGVAQLTIADEHGLLAELISEASSLFKAEG